ncbi:MAG TPA: ABC transporter permease [Blastocatellia bacterium]|nr:ABC transporter permease [Blastocatellia bacterium]
MANLGQDLRFAIRLLLKNPGFSAVAILALALGIGANTAIFSVVDAVLFRPLPFAHPDRLVAVWERDLKKGGDHESVMAGNYLDWRNRSQVFEQMAAHAGGSVNLTGMAEPERIRAARVSAGLFQLLGVQPEAGRLFLNDEDQPGHPRVVVISNHLWKGRFGGDPEVVGRSITLNNQDYEVVGVMPAEFQLPLNEDSEVWTPLVFTPEELTLRNSHYLKVVGRLKPGASMDQASSEMATIASQLEREYPKSNEGTGAAIFPLHSEIVGDLRKPLLIFLGAVAFILLIACANVANLMLSRAAARQREIAVRVALGASRWRLVRQMLIESVVLGLAGGAAGLLLALWGIEFLSAVAQQTSVPRARSIGLDGRVLLFTFAASILTGLIFGSAPALQASKPDLNDALKEGGRSSGSLRRSRTRNLLVVSEMALAFVLLVGAGLLINSFFRLRAVDPGLKPENVLTMNISLPRQKYSQPEQVIAFHRQLLEQVEAVPSIDFSGTVTALPYGGSTTAFGYTIDSPVSGDQTVSIVSQQASPHFFRALGIPTVAGREFNERDIDGALPVVIVSDSLAKRYWPDQDPLGRRIKWGNKEFGSPWMTVVGVVGDVGLRGLDTPPRPTLYVPHLQFGEPIRTRVGVTLRELLAEDARSINLVVRSAGGVEGLASAVRAAVWAVDPNQPVIRVKTMEEVLADTMIVQRFSTLLLASFAGIALALAAAGIYGVISYSVSQRTHEIGIRMALGAEQRDVLRLVVGQGMAPALIGLAIGVAGALGLSRFMTSLLFNVSVTDPITYVVIAGLLSAVAVAACYLPARRAAKVDPMEALRCE